MKPKVSSAAHFMSKIVERPFSSSEAAAAASALFQNLSEKFVRAHNL